MSTLPVAATVSCVRNTVAISEKRLNAKALVSPEIIHFVCWIIFHAFLSSADVFQNLLLKNPFRNTINMLISLDPDQDLHVLGAQWLSGRVLDSRPRSRGFEPHRHHCIVVLEQAGLQIKMRIGKLFSLFLIQNICCGYSKEPSQ